jgi:hypothetical protein
MLPGLEVCLEASQTVDCPSRMRTDPAGMYVPDGKGVQMVPAHAAHPMRYDEARPLKNLQMLHDGASVEGRKMRADLAGRLRLVSQHVEDCPARLIGQSLEDEIVAGFSIGA